jgi:hypothetical protein
MSWSYTAGAYYRLKSLYGSLIFGGYDASRFTPNDVSFTMAGDVHRDLVVTIRSITSTTSSGNTTLMSTPIFSFIDSTIPEIWLPVDVCQQFEKAFGLSLDQTSGLYLIDNSTDENLLNLNPNITFTLANQKTGGPTIDLVLPYASFDLNTTAPVLNNRSSLYFPIKQTSDDTLYTLGRIFLQEAYVTADYNSRTFNVSRCIFDDTVAQYVVAIPLNLLNSTSSGNSTASGGGSGSHKKPDGRAIAGIVIGALAAILLGAALIFFCIRRRRCEPARQSTPAIEIDTGKRVEGGASSAYSAQASAFTSEISGQDAKVGIQGNPIMYSQELEAEVPISQGQDASERVNGLSDSSKDTGVSTMSPMLERPTPLAELGAKEGGLGEDTRYDEQNGPDGRSGEEHIVSPNSGSARENSMMQRGRLSITVSGPITSDVTWTPTTPVQRRNSRFSENWD